MIITLIINSPLKGEVVAGQGIVIAQTLRAKLGHRLWFTTRFVCELSIVLLQSMFYDHIFMSYMTKTNRTI